MYAFSYASKWIDDALVFMSGVIIAAPVMHFDTDLYVH